MLIKRISFAIIAAGLFTVVPAYAQEAAEDAPVEVRSCEDVLRAERECSEGALARIRRACRGEISTITEANEAVFRQFSQLWQQCTGEERTFGSTDEIDSALSSCSPTGSPALRCDEPEAEEAPDPPRRRLQYMCLDSAQPVERRGRTIRCDCPEGLREVRVDYRTVRQELGHPNGVIVVSCANPNPVAESIRREELERVIERLERVERICTDEDGRHEATADEPLICREIWRLIERVAANTASIDVLEASLGELEDQVAANTAGVRRHDETEADRCGVSVEAWVAMSREERRERCRQPDVGPRLDRFRVGLGFRGFARFETGVFSGYGIAFAEWAPRFDQGVGLYVRGHVGYGSYGDVPGQTGEVPLGESGLWGLSAGLELEPIESFTLDIGVAFDSSLIEGQRGDAFGTYRWHNLGPEVRVRFNLHEHFFIEGNVGATWSRTVVESNDVLTDVDGFGLSFGLGLGASF